MNKDLYDHGAGMAIDPNRLSGDVIEYANDDPDITHHGGGMAIDPNRLSGDVIEYANNDPDLTHHGGGVEYAPKSDTWGTNSQELIHQLDLLMHASYSNDYQQAIPQFNAASLAKLVEYRYRQRGYQLEDVEYGLSKEDKEGLGMDMYFDFLLIDNMIQTNPNCMEPIFDPSTALGSREKTDIFGVLAQYQKDLSRLDAPIPLIDIRTGQQVTNGNGQVITAQEMVNYLMSKKEAYTQESSGRSM